MREQAIKKFKQRWAEVNKVQDKELQKLPIREKFHQLASIVRLAIGMHLDLSEDQDKRKVRARWISLKRGVL